MWVSRPDVQGLKRSKAMKKDDKFLHGLVPSAPRDSAPLNKTMCKRSAMSTQLNIQLQLQKGNHNVGFKKISDSFYEKTPSSEGSSKPALFNPCTATGRIYTSQKRPSRWPRTCIYVPPQFRFYAFVKARPPTWLLLHVSEVSSSSVR